MSKQEFIYQIPTEFATDLNSGELIDVPHGRDGLDSVEVGMARVAVVGSYPVESIPTPDPEQKVMRDRIADLGNKILIARKYRLDSELVLSAKDEFDLAA